MHISSRTRNLWMSFLKIRDSEKVCECREHCCALTYNPRRIFSATAFTITLTATDLTMKVADHTMLSLTEKCWITLAGPSSSDFQAHVRLMLALAPESTVSATTRPFHPVSGPTHPVCDSARALDSMIKCKCSPITRWPRQRNTHPMVVHYILQTRSRVADSPIWSLSRVTPATFLHRRGPFRAA